MTVINIEPSNSTLEAFLISNFCSANMVLMKLMISMMVVVVCCLKTN